MLDVILNFKKGETAFRHFCALFMLRELTSSQLAATDATTGESRGTFQYLFRLEPDGIKGVETAKRAV